MCILDYNIMKVLSIDSTADLQSEAFGKFASQATRTSFILLVHAPWCGHCQMLKPRLDAAISASKGVKGLLVKISDEPYTHLTSTNPNHPLSRLMSSTVSGFPTLMHVRSHSTPEKTSMIYKHFEGQREVPELKAFINDHASKPKSAKSKPKSKPSSTTSTKPISSKSKPTSTKSSTKPKTLKPKPRSSAKKPAKNPKK